MIAQNSVNGYYVTPSWRRMRTTAMPFSPGCPSPTLTRASASAKFPFSWDIHKYDRCRSHLLHAELRLLNAPEWVSRNSSQVCSRKLRMQCMTKYFIQPNLRHCRPLTASMVCQQPSAVHAGHHQRSMFCRRTFYVADPTVWNSLQDSYWRSDMFLWWFTVRSENFSQSTNIYTVH